MQKIPQVTKMIAGHEYWSLSFFLIKKADIDAISSTDESRVRMEEAPRLHFVTLEIAKML